MTTESMARAFVFTGHNFAFPRRDAPGLYMSLPPWEGVGNAGCPLHPRSRVHLVVVERTRVTTSTPESPGIPARNGFTAYFVLSPATGLFCHRRRRNCSADLTPASGRQDHTTLPSARQALSSSAPLASTASRPTSVTIAKRPSEWDGMANHIVLILVRKNRNIFSKGAGHADRERRT